MIVDDGRARAGRRRRHHRVLRLRPQGHVPDHRASSARRRPACTPATASTSSACRPARSSRSRRSARTSRSSWSCPTDVKIRADAHAVLMAPNPVSDRSSSCTRPTSRARSWRTARSSRRSTPSSRWSSTRSSPASTQLATTIGPDGANSNGALSVGAARVREARQRQRARDARGDHHDRRRRCPRSPRHPDDLRTLVTGLDTLTSKLAARNDDDRLALRRPRAPPPGSSPTSGRHRLGDREPAAGLARWPASSRRTRRTSAHRCAEPRRRAGRGDERSRSALIQTFDTAPLGFQNFNRAITRTRAVPDPDRRRQAGQLRRLWGRLDLPSNAADFVKTYCGKQRAATGDPAADPVERAGLGARRPRPTPVCGAEIGLLQGTTGPAGLAAARPTSTSRTTWGRDEVAATRGRPSRLAAVRADRLQALGWSSCPRRPARAGRPTRSTAEFADVQNLTLGAKVKLGGVVIGEVTDDHDEATSSRTSR